MTKEKRERIKRAGKEATIKSLEMELGETLPFWSTIKNYNSTDELMKHGRAWFNGKVAMEYRRESAKTKVKAYKLKEIKRVCQNDTLKNG